ncbi:hypothetical protein TcBrA4_0111950 [Trypanosoma cruzi]|nr:hypothetical protein TcBrA4_0111950 [Trypanosoma cruzi]
MAKGKKQRRGEGDAEAPEEDPARERPWNHPRVHPPPGAPWRREAHLRRHLRRGAWRDQVVRGGRRARRHGVHGVLRKKTVTAVDVVNALRKRGKILYGYA